MRDWFDRNATPEDIYLREGDEGVKLEDRDVHGSTVPHVCLDQLLPIAINQNTPIKGTHAPSASSSYKIYVPFPSSKTRQASTVSLGSSRLW